MGNFLTPTHYILPWVPPQLARDNIRAIGFALLATECRKRDDSLTRGLIASFRTQALEHYLLSIARKPLKVKK